MNFSPRNIIALIILAVLAVGLLVSIRLVQQQTQLKSQAAGEFICDGTAEQNFCIQFLDDAERTGNIVVGKAVAVIVVAKAGFGDTNVFLDGTYKTTAPGNVEVVYTGGGTNPCTGDQSYQYCWKFTIPAVTNQVYRETFKSTEAPSGRVEGAFQPQAQPSPSPTPTAAAAANVGTCESITIDGNDYRTSDLAVGKTYQVAIKMKNAKVGMSQTDWNNNYYLLYTGTSKDQLGLSKLKINVSKVKVAVDDFETFNLAMAPTAASTGDPNKGGGFQFHWEMRNDKDQPFLTGSGQCKPNIAVKAAASPAPAGTCPESKAAPNNSAGEPRTWQCRTPGSTNLFGCEQASSAAPTKNYTCADESDICYACAAGAPSPAPAYRVSNTCYQCSNNRTVNAPATDPSCSNTSNGAVKADFDGYCATGQRCSSGVCYRKVGRGPDKCSICLTSDDITFINCADDNSVCSGNTKGSVCTNGTCTSGPTASPTPTPSPTPAVCTPSQGDANKDNSVDLRDFAIWFREANGFAQTTKADFDCKDGVNNTDFEIWRNAYL